VQACGTKSSNVTYDKDSLCIHYRLIPAFRGIEDGWGIVWRYDRESEESSMQAGNVSSPGGDDTKLRRDETVFRIGGRHPETGAGYQSTIK
jgi:hypothetical protein